MTKIVKLSVVTAPDVFADRARRMREAISLAPGSELNARRIRKILREVPAIPFRAEVRYRIRTLADEPTTKRVAAMGEDGNAHVLDLPTLAEPQMMELEVTCLGRFLAGPFAGLIAFRIESGRQLGRVAALADMDIQQAEEL
jgi:hypothetical protein